MKVFYLFLFCFIVSPIFPQSSFLRGDANSDGTRDQSDSIFILEYLYEGGDDPTCMDAADVDNNGAIEQTDAIVLLYHVNYNDPPTLPSPFNACGVDPGAGGELDQLDCVSHICGRKFIRGDTNLTGQVNQDDYTKLNNFLNGQTTLNCKEAGDVNNDGSINNQDLVYLGLFLFQGGQQPPSPFTSCDFDYESYPANILDCQQSSCP